MSKIIIDVENLVHSYKKSQYNVVDDISLKVHEGQLFAFLGPNGAGKTTTISILTTLLKQTSGTVLINDLDNNLDTSEIRKQIGVIFQKPSLDNDLTGEENIRLHVCIYNLYKYSPFYNFMAEEYKLKLKSFAEMLDIQGFLFDKVETYSGGMKRKIEIIRSLMHSPKILFLDEPTTGLDPESRKNIWHHLNKVRHSNGTTIFLTTHYLEEAEQADVVNIINKGKIIYDGTVDKLKSRLMQNTLCFNTKYKSQLINELQQKNIKYENNNDQFIIDITTYNIQLLLRKIDTPINNIKINKPSLESAYLDLISNDGHS